MINIDRELINEDLEFINDYIDSLLDKHPELLKDESCADIFVKIERRMNDINKRLDA